MDYNERKLRIVEMKEKMRRNMFIAHDSKERKIIRTPALIHDTGQEIMYRRRQQGKRPRTNDIGFKQY